MYDCTEITRDHVFTVHLCVDVDEDCLVRSRISVELWTGFDKNLHDGIKVEPDELNNFILLPLGLFVDDEFMNNLAKCESVPEVLMYLDSLHLL